MKSAWEVSRQQEPHLRGDGTPSVLGRLPRVKSVSDTHHRA
jgi:hypothetical protein